MKLENKQLLLKYISETYLDCFVLYDIKNPKTGEHKNGRIVGVGADSVKVLIPPKDVFSSFSENQWVPVEFVKPFLRPISGITDTEKLILRKELFVGIEFDLDKNGTVLPLENKEDGTITFLDFSPQLCGQYITWLGKHQFDYRGLIGKNLAKRVDKCFYEFKAIAGTPTI